MVRGLEIAGLVLAILTTFVSLAGTVVRWIALVIGMVSALSGDKLHPIAMAALSAVKLFFTTVPMSKSAAFLSSECFD